MISFSFYSIQLLLWLILFRASIASLFCHCHVWVRHIYNKKIMVACMTSLLLSIDLQRYCYFIMFYLKLTNGAMEKWWMVKWCNGEIKLGIGCLVYHKYWFYSLFLFYNTTLLQKTKQFIIFNILSLTTSTATAFMLSNQETTKRQNFIRSKPIFVREIVTII